MARESGDLKVTGARRDRKPPMLRAAISGFLLALLASPGLGQAYVRVSGSILDPSDAILSGATVTLAVGNHDLLRTTTDANGTFHFDAVKPGRYQLRAQYAGFRTRRIRINVRSGAVDNSVRLVLAIADLQETVEVHAQKEGLTTNSQDNLDTALLNTSDLEHLPVLNGDIIDALTRLLNPPAAGAASPTVIIDGLPNADPHIRPSEIQEVRINNSPYSAEFAQPGRRRIEIITKTGSSKYHGALEFELRDFRLDARNAFAAARPPERRRQLDADLSGPVAQGGKNTFSLAFNRTQDNLEPIVYGFGLTGPIREDASQSQTSTYLSAEFTRRIAKNAVSFRYSLFDWADKGDGAGGFVLPETASQSTSRYHQFYASDQTEISSQLLNQFFVRVRTQESVTDSRFPGVPKIVVTDAFTGGGAQVDKRGTENRFEFTDTLSRSDGRQLLKAGVNVPVFSRIGSTDRSNQQGTFYFSSLANYPLQPFSFLQQSGDGHLVFWPKQAAGFVQDEVKLRQNLSLAGGLRYEWQNYGADYHNFAPRLSFAYGLGKAMKTVIRAGAGLFYDTVATDQIANMLLLDGSRLRQIQILNPSYPNPFSGLPSLRALPFDVVRFSPTFKSPYTFQYSFAVERQLRKSVALTATYTAMRGVDLYRSRDVNAPLPPLYGSRPDPYIGVLQQLESSARSKSYTLQTAIRGNVSRFFSGKLMYELDHAMDDTDGIGSFPANNWDLHGEWSRASFQARHFLYLYGTLSAGSFFEFGVIFSANTGKPYTLTTGDDAYHNGQNNARPPGVPRNTLSGTGAATLDLRWSRELALHASDKSGFSLVPSVDAFNLFNSVNYTAFVGNLSSKFFGKPVAAAPPRRVQISVSLRF